MIHYKNIIFCFLLLWSVQTMYAQKSWSLDDCITYAITHNLQLNTSRYDQDANRETYRQSIRNLLPSINATSNYNIRYGRSVDPNNNSIVNTDFFSNNYGINADIDLFRGFQKMNQIKASKFLYKASNEQVVHQKYLLAFRIMSAFYDIRFMQGLVEIAKEQETTSQENYDLIKRQVELGQKAKADLYEAESALLADQLLVTQNENNVVGAKLKLVQEMNLENANTITITQDLDAIDQNPEGFVSDKDSIYNTAKTFLPMIKAEELKVKASKKQLAMARGGLYPSLSFFAGYQTGYFETNIDSAGEVISFNDQIKDNASQYVGLSLNIPISNGWSNRSRVKQQKVALMRADNELNVKKQEMYQLIQQLVQEQNSLRIEFEQSLQKVKAQELAFDIAQKKYEKGLISTIELNQSKNLLATSKNENLQVRLRLKVNKSTLEFYNGSPVFNITSAQ